MLLFAKNQSRAILIEVILKFIQKNPTHEIARELDLTERTIYRRINSVLNKIAEFMINENWGLDFIKNQVGDESWIEESYKKKLADELLLKSKGYNKSSSSKSL